MTRRTRPYLFYDTTTSLCAVCLRSVEAKIVFRDEEVFLDKWCPVHGAARVLIADDLAYYRAAREIWLKPPEVPERFATPMKYGCPFDCGLCPDHMQHACLAIVELTDHCNLRCPVCYAGSGPERTESRSRAEIEAMLDAVVATEGEPDVVQLSGGEPTLHPEFLEIVRSAKTRPIRHLMINTNGIRIAREPGFAEALADLGPGIEIYLQFDSQRSTALHALRGADLLRTHEAALDALDRVGLSTTLVATLRRGVNDDEVGSLIRYATTRPCVRGVTFQPVQDAGRNEGATPLARRLTVTEIRRRVAESGVFTLADVVPVPCNPDTLAMAYAVRTPDGLVPLTRYLPPEALLGGPENTIAFERIPGLGERLFGALSTGHSPESAAKSLAEVLCCLPRVQDTTLSYKDVFRVLIVRFMDAEDFDVRAVKRSCVHMAQPDGRLIPFEPFNLFYRPGARGPLDVIRRELESLWAGRR